MTATLLVGDAHERMWELPDHSFDLIITSPPFPWLRSYLPDDHPQKHLEIGREASPAKFMDVMLRLTAEWRRLLTPTGSLAVEFGDVYAGSGGAGGDYDDDGMRAGQNRFRMIDWSKSGVLTKSLCGIPHAYMLSLVLGYNVYDRRGPDSPAGQWLVRNYKSWFRTNPPVGRLGDKERSATSYITVACLARDRWFDLDAVRTAPSGNTHARVAKDAAGRYDLPSQQRDGNWSTLEANNDANPGGAPPLDWWHQTDAVIDRVINDRAGKYNGGRNPEGRPITEADTRRLDATNSGSVGHGNRYSEGDRSVGARGVHIRRALTDAGILPPHPDTHDISPRGYTGAHYAVWPPELVKQLVNEMCPRKVCTVCGQPSRRITVDKSAFSRQPELAAHIKERREALGITSAEINGWFGYKEIAKNWERTDRHGAAIPNPGDWLILSERLELDRERFDDLVLGERRWTESTTEQVEGGTNGQKSAAHTQGPSYTHRTTAIRSDLGWSDCGHGTWRPGRILDPFSGSGTTLATATGMGRDAVGIDLDQATYGMTIGRLGPLIAALELDVHWPEPNWNAPALNPASPYSDTYKPWRHMLGDHGQVRAELRLMNPLPRRPVVHHPGQGTLL